MGTPEYAAVSLRRLLATRHRVRAVVTRPDKPRGRGQQLEAGPVKRVAMDAGIEVLDPVSARDEGFLARLRELRADLGVVVAYGRILPKAALEAPRLGCINAHASLLPKLRGAAPIERAILAGLETTGVTIMQMDEGLDTGDMLVARELPLPGTMNGLELRERLAELSAALLVEAVDGLADGGWPRVPQDSSEATFAPPLRKSEAAIHWNEDARELWLRVRAFAPRPGAFAFDDAQRLKILDARVARQPIAATASPGSIVATGSEGFAVACGRGALEILTLQPEGKRPMRALDWLRGARHAAGHRLRDGE